MIILLMKKYINRHTDPVNPGQVLKKKNFVFINAQLNSISKATQLGSSKFHISRQSFLPQGYGIACSSGSPLRDAFSSVLVLPYLPLLIPGLWRLSWKILKEQSEENHIISLWAAKQSLPRVKSHSVWQTGIRCAFGSLNFLLQALAFDTVS